MEGNHNNSSQGNNYNQGGNYNQQYLYDQYNAYYYSQGYGMPLPQVPQGDPSAAVSSMVYQLQQQTQQRQAMGAMAAASVSSALGNRNQSADYYADYYNTQNQRSVINYDDLSQQGIASLTKNKKLPQENIEDPNAPSAKKPKFCCNRWLKSAIAVAQHEKLHIKCPSCDYMCLKSALQEHEENAHGKAKIENDKKPSRPDGIIPPNAPRIETPEELAAWIAERKKNWPSKENVERKAKEDAEKEARGELVNTKKRTGNNRKDQQNSKRQKVEEKKNSLVAQYDSDSDSEDDIMDPEKDAVSSKDPSAMGKILLPEDRPKRRCKYFAMGKCNKGDQCNFSHEKPEQKPKQPKPAPTFKKRPNLLYKLLEKEILQEKSVILQCLRYIVDNDFFGHGDGLSKVEESKVEAAIVEETKVEATNTEEENNTAEETNTAEEINTAEEPKKEKFEISPLQESESVLLNTEVP